MSSRCTGSAWPAWRRRCARRRGLALDSARSDALSPSVTGFTRLSRAGHSGFLRVASTFRGDRRRLRHNVDQNGSRVGGATRTPARCRARARSFVLGSRGSKQGSRALTSHGASLFNRQHEPWRTVMIKTIAAVVVVLLVVGVGGVLAYAATKPDTFRVERALVIKASPEKIFPLINDLRAQSAWSPFEKDPDMKRTHSGTAEGPGAVYEWDGNREVGAG